MASLRLRLLEWFADSSPRVQYPVPRASQPGMEREEQLWLGWKHSMPLSTRLFLVLMSLFVIAIGVPVAALLLLVIAAFVRSLL